MPELEFKVHGEITPAQLAKLARAQTIVRSAHLGNVGLYNLAGAAKLSQKRRKHSSPGITLLLLDHNLLGRDVNYRPNAVIFKHSPTAIFSGRTKDVSGQALPDFLSPFTPLSEKSKAQLAGLLGVNEKELPGTLAAFHYQTAKKAYGGGAGSVMTWSEYLNHHEKLLRSILTSWIKSGKYTLFDRVVMSNGETAHLISPQPQAGELRYQVPVSGAIARVPVDNLVEFTIEANRRLAEAVKTGIKPKPLDATPGYVGVMFNVEASTALGALLEARKAHPFGTKFDAEKMVVYHLSGPDYIKYASKPEFVKEVKELVSLARPVGAFPKAIEFHLLPQTHLNVAGDKKTAEKLEEIVARWKDVSTLQREKGERVKAASPTEKQRVIADYDAKLRVVRDSLIEKIHKMREHFADHAAITGLKRTTIYDVAYGDHGHIYLPRNARRLTLTELGRLQKFIEGVIAKKTKEK